MHSGSIFCKTAVVALLLSVASAQDTLSEVNRKLSAYEQTFLALKTPYTGSKLRFRSDGQIQGKANLGTWMNSGFIYVENAKTNGQIIQIKAQRALLMYDRFEGKTGLSLLGQSVSIEIEVGSIQQSNISTALGAVFRPDPLADRLQKYWRPEFDPKQEWTDATKGWSTKPIGTLEGRAVYRVEPGLINPPQIVSTPDPDYPLGEKSKRREGHSVTYMIVDENGDPALISLKEKQPSTFDRQALQAISKWKFRPATFNGNPVPVAINVEINFKLY